MEIPNEILQNLKCSQCDEYLTCGPVYLVSENQDSICGRCSTAKETSSENQLESFNLEGPKKAQNNSKCIKIRNFQYEFAAKLLLFPCRYAQHGCKAKIPFSSESPHPHEISCEFKPHICPMIPNGVCDWMGNCLEFLDHCKEFHPRLVLENTCEIQPNISQNNLTNYVINAFDLLFLLHTKTCMSTGKMFHSVRLLNDPLKSNLFKFQLMIQRGNIDITKTGKVLPPECLTIQEPTSISTNINSLLDLLGGFSDTTCTIIIDYETSKLKTPLEEIVPLEVCNVNGFKCKNSIFGCDYIDENKEKYVKHILYFCNFVSKCPYCNEILLQDDKIFEHFTNTLSSGGHNAIISYNNTTWRSKTRINQSHLTLLSHEILTSEILCDYCINNSEFQLLIFTSLNSKDLKDFTCSVEIREPETENSMNFTPDIVYNNWWDWRIVCKLDSFQNWSQSGVDVNVAINKIN